MGRQKILKVHNKSDKPDNVVMKEQKIVADREGVCRLKYDGKILLVQDENGNEIDVDFADGVTSFHAQPGVAYTFS